MNKRQTFYSGVPNVGQHLQFYCFGLPLLSLQCVPTRGTILSPAKRLLCHTKMAMTIKHLETTVTILNISIRLQTDTSVQTHLQAA